MPGINARIDEIIAEQGWNSDTMLKLCRDFIEETDNNEAFVAFLRSQQAEENGQAKEDGSKGQPT